MDTIGPMKYRHLRAFLYALLLYLPLFLLFLYSPLPEVPQEQTKSVPVKLSHFLPPPPPAPAPPTPKPVPKPPQKPRPAPPEKEGDTQPAKAQAAAEPAVRPVEETNATRPPAPAVPDTGSISAALFNPLEMPRQIRPPEKKEEEPGAAIGDPEILELYGEDLAEFTPEQREFLDDNLNRIGRITQKYLRYPRLAGRLGMGGVNTLEFTLYPSGDISEIRVKTPSGYSLLDDNSVETVETAYKEYPRPAEPTLVRIRVYYLLY